MTKIYVSPGGAGKNRPVMDWASRKKVAIGAARGLAYLHEDCHPRIIHREYLYIHEVHTSAPC